jgi:hypothetical protein
VGYRYGEHRYSEGLYSRWPDWWHDKACANELWVGQACVPAPFAELPALGVRWQAPVSNVTIWADDPSKVPHPEQRPVKWQRTR